jgi:putative membrane protein
MKSSQEHNWNTPQRQANAGLFVITYKALFTIIKAVWPLLLVVIFRDRNKTFDTLEMMLVGIPALILIRSLIDFFYFRFYIENEDLVIKKGFLSKKVITIPLGKIHSVHIEQNLVHQVLDVAKLTIDTAGSEKAEDFKQFLMRNQKDIPPEGQLATFRNETPLIRLSTGDLFKLGLSANHLQTFFIVLAFSFSMLQNLQEIFENRVIRIVQESFSSIGFSLGSLIALIVFVLIISVVVSVVRIVLNYANFNCAETEKGYRVQTGLISTRQNLVPFSKVQYISWGANWIRRQIGLFMLEFHQAQNEQAKRKQRIRLPITKKEYIVKLLESYHPAVKSIADSTHTMHKVYPVRRMLLAGIPTAVIISAIAFIWLKWYTLLFFLWVPYVYIINSIYRKRFRLYISREAFQLTSGIWGKKSKLAQWYKIQYMELIQSIYQRRKKLATLVIHTAGGQIKIPYIDVELARMIQNYALYKIESSEKSWM